MYPYLWVQHTEAGPVEYGTYGLMLVLAFLAAALVSGVRFKKVGLNGDAVVPLMVVAIISSILGARLLHFLGSPADRILFFDNPLVLFQFSKGGMAVMGGQIAGVIFGSAYIVYRKMDPWKVADVGGAAMMLGSFVGRMGCFFAGCCHGRIVEGAQATSSLTGDLFPGGEILLLDGFPFVAYSYHAGQTMGSIYETAVYPTQTYEALGTLLGFLVLSWFWKNYRKFDGQIMAMTMIWYPLLRFPVEHYRGDAIRGEGYFGLFSTSQVASLGVVLAGFLLILWRFRKGVAPEVPIVDTDEDIDVDDLI
ncbi:MAG: prolipoprotein diacylglyceryl transferase [Proteobacteria bacterium]|nr:prolipoprotein diacylglyceryl transferase [Pseudomonadota bacterium]MCP4917433.1 prolipoprotein diacylglyceryl transferase [Pseudomonadota bacterium]